jgi:hypothetical protein
MNLPKRITVSDAVHALACRRYRNACAIVGNLARNAFQRLSAAYRP